jgi:hypothetical protein
MVLEGLDPSTEPTTPQTVMRFPKYKCGDMERYLYQTALISNFLEEANHQQNPGVRGTSLPVTALIDDRNNSNAERRLMYFINSEISMPS